ncbi:MAG: Fpg/Nei family DNA glycosylase [Verrucomicrobiaceae bacterium]
MPELAEVAFYAKQWEPAVGQAVLRVLLHGKSRVFRKCDLATLERKLPGRRLVGAKTHGKQMLFQFTEDCSLGIHLGMTGALRVEPAGFEPGRHDHLVLHMAGATLVFHDPRQFGNIHFHSEHAWPTAWQALPPQPMDAAFTTTRLTQILEQHARQPLKALLLVQRHFPGIGNWMADEVLWQMKLPPQHLAGNLSAAQRASLHRVLRKVCSVALQTIGVDWSDPPQTWLFRYRWEPGHKCPRCHGELVRETVRGRTACWCPTCQPAPE